MRKKYFRTFQIQHSMQGESIITAATTHNFWNPSRFSRHTAKKPDAFFPIVAEMGKGGNNIPKQHMQLPHLAISQLTGREM